MPAGRPDPVSHEAIMDRLKSGDEKFDEIASAIADIKAAVTPIPAMQADVAATKEIVEAWAAVKTVGRFIKWAGPILAAIIAVFAATKASILFMFKG